MFVRCNVVSVFVVCKLLMLHCAHFCILICWLCCVVCCLSAVFVDFAVFVICYMWCVVFCWFSFGLRTLHFQWIQTKAQRNWKNNVFQIYVQFCETTLVLYQLSIAFQFSKLIATSTDLRLITLVELYLFRLYWKHFSLRKLFPRTTFWLEGWRVIRGGWCCKSGFQYSSGGVNCNGRTREM